MKTVNYTATLLYYDGPQIFEARDAIGGHYIGMLATEEEKYDSYLIKGVNPNRLAEFRAGVIDLKTLLLDLDQEQWYLANLESGLKETINLMPQNTPITESGLLPDEGLILHDFPTDDLVVQEAHERNNVILEVTAESLHNAGEHRMKINVFTELLGCINNLVKHAYQAAMKDALSKNSELKYNKDGHILDVVVPAAAGSFRVIFESAHLADIFGHNELNHALRRMDALFESAAQWDENSDALQKHRGHLAGNFLNLLRLLEKHEISIGYAWATPESTKPNLQSVSFAQVKPLMSSLSKISNLSEEEVTLSGKFEKFNLPSGIWGLNTEDGKKSGKIKSGGPTLDGLKVGERYQFDCIEEITQSSTGDEVRTLYLQKHKPV